MYDIVDDNINEIRLKSQRLDEYNRSTIDAIKQKIRTAFLNYTDMRELRSEIQSIFDTYTTSNRRVKFNIVQMGSGNLTLVPKDDQSKKFFESLNLN